MARTQDRSMVVSGQGIAEETAALAKLGAEEGLWSEEDLKVIFTSIAPACKTMADRKVFLAKCRANGLSPLKGELFATRRVMNKGKPNEYETIVYVTSYHVFMSRARRAGFVITGQEVWSDDEWAGWDAVAMRPVKHIVAAPHKSNARLIGAWASAKNLRTGQIDVGHFWPLQEAMAPGYNPVAKTLPGHMLWKTAACRVARMVAPDLSSLYGAEEMGYAVLDEGDRVHVPREIADVTPIQPEDQLKDQTVEVNPEPEDEKPDLSPEEAKEEWLESPISFVNRTGLLKAMAASGVTSAAAILKEVSGMLGREVEDTKSLTNRDALALSAKVDGYAPIVEGDSEDA